MMTSRITMAGVLTLMMLWATAVAAEPPGFAKGKKKGFEGGQPRGFTQGEKKGWLNEYPPGWDKKTEKEKTEWKKSVKKGRKKITRIAKKKGFKEGHIQSARDDFEKAARKGISVEEGVNLVVENIQKGHKGVELSKAVVDERDNRIKDKEKGKDKKEKVSKRLERPKK